jgi:hypothetical protein
VCGRWATTSGGSRKASPARSMGKRRTLLLGCRSRRLTAGAFRQPSSGSTGSRRAVSPLTQPGPRYPRRR